MNFKHWLYPNTYGIKVDAVLFILRIFFGGFILLHGYPKLEKLLSGSSEFADPFGIGAQASLFLAVFAEFVCGGKLKTWRAKQCLHCHKSWHENL